MNDTSTLTINCTYCGKENKINSQYLKDLVACRSCGEVLYELDETMRDIRITKRFRELYQILLPQIGDIRKMLVKFDKEINLSYCNDDVQIGIIDKNSIIPEKNITGVGEIIKKLFNENNVSDENTSSSMVDFFSILENYIKTADDYSSMFDGSKNTADLKESYRNLRSLEKEVNAFVRMMTVYLGETVVKL